MAGGFCRGRAAPAVESKIFFSRSDRPEISIRQKLNKEQMEISGRPCRKEVFLVYDECIRKAKDGDNQYTFMMTLSAAARLLSWWFR